MIKRHLMILLYVLLLVLFAVPGWSQDQTPAGDLDDLLQRVREGRTIDQGVHRQREADFRAARDQQKQMLDDARARLRDAEKRSERLENSYNANDLRIVEVTEQLDRRLGSMKELFGVLQQVTGDTKGLLDNSITSAQFPDRGEFLLLLNGKLASDSALPTIEEIEHLLLTNCWPQAVLKITVTRGVGGRGYRPEQHAESTRIVQLFDGHIVTENIKQVL